jgi:hypothetical protein
MAGQLSLSLVEIIVLMLGRSSSDHHSFFYHKPTGIEHLLTNHPGER